MPAFRNDHPNDEDMLPFTDETLTLRGVARRPVSVTLMGDGILSVTLPASRRTKLVDVAQVDLA